MRTTLLSAAAILSVMTVPAAAEQGDLLVRLRGIMVAPNEDSGPVLPTFPTATVSVDDAIVPELDFTYFFTDNIGAELILATSPHDVSGEGALAGLGEIADAMVLPPTLTLQYHFMPDAAFRPYVGVGVNWTIFYSEDAKTSLTDAIGPTSVSMDDSFGWAAQVGFDIPISDRVFLNADVKYIDIDTTATLTTGALVNTVDVDIDPFVFGIGVGMRF
ncbi:OmpW family protein [Marinicaulis aureus]|uniref:OmpW family protein n=1 Tax=Hyphococcus aureus TaxID=2666033 RepID=A0ABW1KZ39_9PROT